MPAGDDFFGGYYRQNPLTTNVTLHRKFPRFMDFWPSAKRDINLPDARKMPLGGPWFAVSNSDNTNDLDIRDDGGNLVHTIQQGKMAFVFLIDNSTANGVWRFATRIAA